MYHSSAIASVSLAILLAFNNDRVFAADDFTIHFDLPPVVATKPSQSDPTDPTLVTVQLRMSSMISSPEMPSIDQWLVKCQPRDQDMSIADYAPRTEASSDVSTPIQIKQTKEESQSVGVSLEGTYGHLAHGNLGSDHGKKNVSTTEFHRHAPVQAVTAAGTINRGRGVYFKLRWTAQQILEGEKVFDVTFRVPSWWRGSLLDVSVLAQAQRKTFGGLDREIKTIGAGNFVVAAYRGGDEQAGARARELADAEFALREVARSLATRGSAPSLPSMLRQVAMMLDLESNQPNGKWLPRLLVGSANPYSDREITNLPLEIRLAAIDYADSREEFAALNQNHRQLEDSDADRVIVAKPGQ